MNRSFPALQELGDGTRLRVFLALLGARKNVSQIVAELELAQPQVSYHLRKLKDAGLAVEEKDGRWVWYQANWEAHDPHLREFIDLMARWAERSSGAAAPRPKAVAVTSATGGRRGGTRPSSDRSSNERPSVERPSVNEEELDDFLL